jgi:hypothetical protein
MQPLKRHQVSLQVLEETSMKVEKLHLGCHEVMKFHQASQGLGLELPKSWFIHVYPCFHSSSWSWFMVIATKVSWG